MPYHNDAQKNPNAYSDPNYMATLMNNLGYNTAVALEKTGDTWTATTERREVVTTETIGKSYYDPDFLVESIMINGTEKKEVKVDLPNGSGIRILCTPGKDFEFRVTRVYLETTTPKYILLLA